MQHGNYILGIDLGCNSLGWAVIDEPGNRILGIGVRIFPEGVDRDTTGAEHPKNEQRRITRGHRRQIARRARRKAVVRMALKEAGLWPGNSSDETKLLQLDPYELRARGLDEKLTLAELGRVLLHLSQRRGFLSNRKADRGRGKENSETLQEISALANRIQASGLRTLGEYLHSFPKDELQDRIRDRHTRREMFEQEFEALWESQCRFYPDELTDTLKYGRQGKQTYPREPLPLKRREGNTFLQDFGFHGLLFFQRSLYWPKSVIGRCDLEPREKRCERADRLAQRFRLLNEVNNLRVIPQKGDPRSLTPKERETLIEHLSGTKEAEFGKIRKWLKLLEGDGFNLEAGSRKKLDGAPIDAAMSHRSLFGKAWAKVPEDLKNEIVRSLIDDEEADILRKATMEWGCSEEVAAALADTDLTAVVKGYSSYSRVAIAKLLPYLEAGLPLMTRDGAPSALAAASYLRPDQKNITTVDFLPSPPQTILNPLVKQGLHEVRKVVNAIIREWGKPKAIHIELAREVQGSAEKRRKAAFDMREREGRRNKAADFIRERGGRPTRDSIERFLLWKEQGEICLYSGKTISPQQLFGGEVDVEHILPYSLSLDNSLMNKVLAFRDENRRKGQRTVWEWVGESEPLKFDEILQRAQSLPYEVRNRKLLKLKQKAVELTEFLNRQLTDTAYLTSQVREYLLPLVADPLRDLVCIKGQLTAELRHLWGLNSVLRDDGLNLKNREDHRHHAVDALVVALTNRSRLQQLAQVRGASIEERAEKLPAPWSNFRDVVQELVDGIRVSHRSVRDLNGALHKETLYGPTMKRQNATNQPRPHAQDWIENDKLFVYRKPLENLTLAEVENIRDRTVKALVIERLKEHGLEAGRKKKGSASSSKIPKAVWEKPLMMIRQGTRKTISPSVIKKVRILENTETIQPIRDGSSCVIPGNTHHISLFELPGSTPEKPKRDMIAVSMMDASQRALQQLPLVSRVHPTIPEAKFLFSLSWGELILAQFGDQLEDIYVYRTSGAITKQMKFVHHMDARKSADIKEFTAKPNTLRAVKITVDPLGRIRNAND